MKSLPKAQPLYLNWRTGEMGKWGNGERIDVCLCILEGSSNEVAVIDWTIEIST